MRGVRRAAGGGKSVVRRPEHVRLSAVLQDGRSGPRARCDRCGGEADLSALDKGSAELVLGEFLRYHRACRPPITEEEQRLRVRAVFGGRVGEVTDPGAVRRRAQELLAQALRGGGAGDR